jgi:hypothetical protein
MMATLVRHLLRGAAPFCVAVALVATAADAARAALIPSFAASDRGGYSGSFAQYSSLANALAGTNAVSTGTVQQRDLEIYMVNQVPTFGVPGVFDAGPNRNVFMPQWFYTSTAGTPNPNNVRPSFVQIFDDNGNTDTRFEGFWTSSALNQFRMIVEGENALPPAPPAGDDARFGDAVLANAERTGSWLSYSFDTTYTLPGTATLNPSFGPGFYHYQSTTVGGEPTAISGTFRGIFQASTGPDAFYVVNLTINRPTTTFALTQLAGGTLGTGEPFLFSQFGSATVVPAPPALLLGLVGIGIGVLNRRWNRPAVA